MNSTDHIKKYYVIIPISLFFILIALILACLILCLVILFKRLHTITHLLICNCALATIYYCLIQCINYIFLIFITNETSHISCRWRAFFGYMTVTGIVYSYLSQAISRFFILILSIKYQWTRSIRIYFILILIQWLIVIILPLPALLTNDISYQSFSLCWVPKEYPLHLAYTIFAYYFLPACFIFLIYIRIKNQNKRIQNRSHRDFDVLCNIMILFAIYIFSAVPIIIHIITRNEIFYIIGLISVSLGITIEKFVTLYLDRDFRNIICNYFHRVTNQIRPL